MQDSELLRQYLQHGSEPAFAELVKRYVDLVFATARRQLGDPHLAEEVSQTVFCLLARKAGNLTGTANLAGWLYRATSLSAARVRRTELRRRRREHEAATMNALEPNPIRTWDHLAPLLDQALNQLAEKDRLAVLLRFFQRKPMRQVGEALGASEAAAKMRVGRSIERLREFFAGRGIVCSAAALSALLTERAAEAAPATLAPRITTGALSGAAAGGTSGLSLFQTLRLMLGLKAGSLVVAGLSALVLLAGGWQTYSLMQRSAARRHLVQPANPALVTAGPNRLLPLKSHTPAIPIDAELQDAIANLRAALHSTTEKVIPGARVVEAVERFGAHGQVAFEILKEEAQAHDPARHSAAEAELAPRRALCAMGFLGKAVPEVAPFLWATFNSEPSTASDSFAYDALSALDHLGFEPRDIAMLAQNVLALPKPTGGSGADPTDDPAEAQTQPPTDDAFVKSQVAEWIATMLKQQPAATAPYLPAVQSLLSYPDEGARFWGACALLQSQGAANPALLEVITAGLKSGGSERLAWASQLLQGLGEVAQPFAAVLLAAAQASSDQSARNFAFLAAGKLDPALRSQSPDVDRALAKDESDQALLTRVNTGTYTGNELVAALNDPGSVEMAATLLGQMGPAATNALPALFACLSGQDHSHCADVLQAIRKIDPQAALAPEEAFSIATNVVQRLLAQPSADPESTMHALGEEGFLSLAWCTRQGFPDLARRLAATNTAAYNALVTAVLEKAPAWRTLLTK